MVQWFMFSSSYKCSVSLAYEVLCYTKQSFYNKNWGDWRNYRLECGWSSDSLFHLNSFIKLKQHKHIPSPKKWQERNHKSLPNKKLWRSRIHLDISCSVQPWVTYVILSLSQTRKVPCWIERLHMYSHSLSANNHKYNALQKSKALFGLI